MRQPEEDRVALKATMDPKEINGQPKGSGRSPSAKFGLFGLEMIEKEVKARGSTGRIYLPPDWVGKVVKIIRID